MLSRRRFLGGVLGLGALAVGGNYAYQSTRPMLYVVLQNFDDEPHTLTTRLVRRDATELSEGTVFTDTTRLAARDDGEGPDGEGHVPWAKIYTRAPARPYLVRVEIEDIGTTEEYTYIPDCAGDVDGDAETVLAVSLMQSRGLRFQQTKCSSDSFWY